jgi:DHA2 family multidrug resistance protein
MAADATFESIAPTPELSPVRRYVILSVIILSVTLYSTSILIVAAVLPQLQGAMSATPDEISWTMTFNILATAVMTPLTGWLAARFGRRNLLGGSVAIMAVATYFCGAATTLESLIFWRIVQGAAGASLPPIGQSVTLNIFPKHQHGMVIGMYGVGVVMGAFIGPMIGGVMAELYTWRYAFYMLAPIAVFASIGVMIALPRTYRTQETKLEWTGFLLLSISIACVQLALSRGQRLDWFQSPEIIIEVFIGALAFYLFIAHSLTHDKPFLNLKLLFNRNYTIGLILVTIYGMLNFTPMVILPGLLREHVGMPDSLIGYVVGSRGIGAMIAFCIAGFVSQKFPRRSIVAGFLLQVIAGLWLMTVNLNTTPLEFVLNGIVQGLAVGTIWVPLTVVTFSTLDQKDLDETSAIYHLLRNLGSSFFISLCVTQLVRSTATNYEYMTSHISHFNPLLGLPWVMGERSIDTANGLAHFSNEIFHQASLISYLNAFGMYTMVSALAIPFIVFVSSPKKKSV